MPACDDPSNPPPTTRAGDFWARAVTLVVTVAEADRYTSRGSGVPAVEFFGACHPREFSAVLPRD